MLKRIINKMLNKVELFFEEVELFEESILAIKVYIQSKI